MISNRRLATWMLAVVAIIAAAAVAEAGPRRGGRQSNPAAINAKAQALVTKANSQINAQSARFERCIDDCEDDLDDLARRAGPRMRDQEVTRFAVDFEDDLLDDEAKTRLKIDRAANQTLAKLQQIGAPSSYRTSVETTRSRARATINSSVGATLTNLDFTVRAALAVCRDDDDDDDNNDDHSNGRGDDDDDDDRGGWNGGGDDDDRDDDDDDDNDDNDDNDDDRDDDRDDDNDEDD